MADDEVVVTLGSTAEDPLDDLPVRPTTADPEDPDEHAAAVRNILDARPPDLAEMERVGFAGDDGNASHRRGRVVWGHRTGDDPTAPVTG